MPHTPKGNGSIHLACLYCGRPHKVWRSYVRKGLSRGKATGAFCSMKCWRDSWHTFLSTCGQSIAKQFEEAA